MQDPAWEARGRNRRVAKSRDRTRDVLLPTQHVLVPNKDALGRMCTFGGRRLGESCGAAGENRVRWRNEDGGGVPPHAPGRAAGGPPIPSRPCITAPRKHLEHPSSEQWPFFNRESSRNAM